LRALFHLPKAIGSVLIVRPNAVGSGCQVRPKTLPKKPTVLGLPPQQDLIVLGLADPDPTHFKKRLGLAAEAEPPILGLAM